MLPVAFVDGATPFGFCYQNLLPVHAYHERPGVTSDYQKVI